MPETPAEAFDRGEAAGQVAARLAGHDKHFDKINGSMADVAAKLQALTLAVQRLGDQAVSRDATVITTAAALKDAEDARRDKSERAWSPLSRVSLAVGIVVALFGLAVTLYLAVRR